MQSRRRFLRSAAAMAGGLAAGGALGLGAWRMAPPSVLLICVDALRADRLGYAGSRRGLTPFIDSVASRGTAFTGAVASSSWTKTAAASILTGLDPFVHSATDVETPLPRDAHTLSTILSARGYVTFCFQTNPWLGEEEQGFQRGYDLFRFLSRSRTKGNRIHVPVERHGAYVDGAAVAERTARLPRWLRELGKPFFGYVHIMDVHGPYLPPPPYDSLWSKPGSGGAPDEALAGRLDAMKKEECAELSEAARSRIVDLYDGGVRYGDEIVRRIVEPFAAAGLLRNTILAICSDHGEELWEHAWIGHAKTLYEEVLNVPLVMAGPGLPAGRIVEEPVRHVDILPTILELAGARAPATVDGRSALDLAGGASRDATAYANIAWLGNIAERRMRSLSTAAPHVKLIITDEGGAGAGAGGGSEASRGGYELYNLRHDPFERENLAASYAELASALSARLDAALAASSGRAASAAPVAISDEMREQLRALGYLN